MSFQKEKYKKVQNLPHEIKFKISLKLWFKNAFFLNKKKFDIMVFNTECIQLSKNVKKKFQHQNQKIVSHLDGVQGLIEFMCNTR